MLGLLFSSKEISSASSTGKYQQQHLLIFSCFTLAALVLLASPLHPSSFSWTHTKNTHPINKEGYTHTESLPFRRNFNVDASSARGETPSSCRSHFCFDETQFHANLHRILSTKLTCCIFSKSSFRISCVAKMKILSFAPAKIEYCFVSRRCETNDLNFFNTPHAKICFYRDWPRMAQICSE